LLFHDLELKLFALCTILSVHLNYYQLSDEHMKYYEEIKRKWKDYKKSIVDSDLICSEFSRTQLLANLLLIGLGCGRRVKSKTSYNLQERETLKSQMFTFLFPVLIIHGRKKRRVSTVNSQYIIHTSYTLITHVQCNFFIIDYWHRVVIIIIIISSTHHIIIMTSLTFITLHTSSL